MDTWTRLMARLRRDAERGASLVEHLFVVSLIAVVCMTAVAYFGTQNGDSMQKSADAISGTAVECPAPGQINQQGICEM
jgi:Flp pilus assembly pilin Flp